MQGLLLLLSLALSFHRGKRLSLMNRELKVVYEREIGERGEMFCGSHSVHICPVIKVQRDLCVPRAKLPVMSFDPSMTGNNSGSAED